MAQVPLPPELSYGTITGLILTGIKDGPDVDSLPDGVPATGVIKFTCDVPYITAGGKLVMFDQIVVPLQVDGSFSVSLISTDDPDTNPTGFTWKIDLSNVNKVLPVLHIAVPTNVITDISSLFPVAVSQGVLTMQGGPVGPQGIQGIPGTVATMTAYIGSRGTGDLVTNGYATMGDNTNFTAFDIDKSDAPNGAAASFVGRGVNVQLDELVSVDPFKNLMFSYQMRQTSTSTTAIAYGFASPIDAFKLPISPNHYMYHLGTTTTLALPLNIGDTKITLTNSTGWWGTTAKPAGAATHYRSLIFWDYTDPGGKLWPPETYSRNSLIPDQGAWADGGLVGNVITLSLPWAGPNKPAGTILSNGSSGGTYMYGGATGNIIPKTWTRYSASVKGLMVKGNSSATFSGGWPPAVGYARIGWLINYSDTSHSRHAVAAVSLERTFP